MPQAEDSGPRSQVQGETPTAVDGEAELIPEDAHMTQGQDSATGAAVRLEEQRRSGEDAQMAADGVPDQTARLERQGSIPATQDQGQRQKLAQREQPISKCVNWAELGRCLQGGAHLNLLRPASR